MTALAGRRVLVVGAASGIGAATARAARSAGASVAVADLDAAGARATAEAVDGTGLAMDVTDRASVDCGVDAAAAALGGLDGVCCTAGIPIAGALSTIDDDTWARCLDVNLSGAFRIARAATPHLRAAGGGALVLMSSTAGLAGSRGQAAYCAAKHGVVGLTRALADELAPQQIRVCCLCPGWVDTPFNDPFWAQGDEDAVETVLSSVPQGRQGTPAEVAAAAVFLLSAGASYLTGVALEVDGGLVAAR